MAPYTWLPWPPLPSLLHRDILEPLASEACSGPATEGKEVCFPPDGALEKGSTADENPPEEQCPGKWY